MVKKIDKLGWVNTEAGKDLQLLVDKIINENYTNDDNDLNTKNILSEEVFDSEPNDKDDEYMKDRNYYSFYYLLSKELKPKTIAEIGTRLGYSLISLIKGSKDTIEKIYSYDLEAYEENSCEKAKNNIEKATGFLNTIFTKCNSQEIEDLQLENKIDLFNVDGDHTVDGALHDLELALNATKNGGYIIFDDIIGSQNEDGSHRSWGDDLREQSIIFCKKHSLDFCYLPTTRGLMIIKVKK